MFTTLLIQTCDIQQKTLSQSDYEQVEEWTDIATDVPCRRDSANSVGIADTELRVNTDDDLFFFNPDVNIRRGNRIVFETEYFDVIKVNKLMDSQAVHHIEVLARYVDNN